MTTAAYLGGASALGLFIIAVGFVSVRVQSLVLPQASTPVAWVTRLVIGVSAADLIAEALGTFGWLSRWTLVGTALGLAVCCLRISRVRREPLSISFNPCAVYVALCIALVAGQSLLAVWRTAHTGILWSDSLQYHLTNAAGFAHSHHTSRILLDSAQTPTPYYPLNDELLFGVGMALFGRDTPVLFMGLLDIAAALLTVWALAAHYGRTVVTAAIGGATYLVLAFGPDVAPGALNDWHTTWLVLAALVFVLELIDASPRRLAVVCLGGLAAGQAAGTKLDALIPVVAVFALALVFAGPMRRRTAWMFPAMALVGGGYWYARDAILVHNPLPNIDLHTGLPHAYPTILKSIEDSVAHYLPHPSIVRHYFVPGLHQQFGLLWPVALIAIGVGLVGAVVVADRRTKALGAIGLVSIAVYLVIPSGAAGRPNDPFVFVYNIRYALVGYVLGLICLGALRPRGRSPVIVATLALTLSITVLARPSGWADDMRRAGAEFVVASAIVVAAAIAGCFALSRRRAVLIPSVVVVAGLLIGLGYPFNSFYLRHRYHQANDSYVQLLSWLPPASHTRIAILGQPNEYSFYGPTWDNNVVFVGHPSPPHLLARFTSCSELRTTLAAGHFAYVVYQPNPYEPYPEGSWLQSDPDATPVLSNATGVVYRLRGMSLVGCPSQALPQASS